MVVSVSTLKVIPLLLPSFENCIRIVPGGKLGAERDMR